MKKKGIIPLQTTINKIHWIIPLFDSVLLTPKEIVYFYLKVSIRINIFIYLLQSTRPITKIIENILEMVVTYEDCRRGGGRGFPKVPVLKIPITILRPHLQKIRLIRPKEWVFYLVYQREFSFYEQHKTFTFQQDPDEPGGTDMRIHLWRTTLYIQGSAPQPTFCPTVTSRSGSRDCRSLSAYLYATVSLQECSRN